MKSNERSFHGSDKIGNGHNNPTVFLVSYFVCWQSRQAITYWWTSFFIFGHRKFSLTCARVLVMPMCPLMGVAWNYVNITWMSLNLCNNQMWPYCKTKSWVTVQSVWLDGLLKMACRNAMKSLCLANSYLSSFKKAELRTDSNKDWPMELSGIRDRASATTFVIPKWYWIE